MKCLNECKETKVLEIGTGPGTFLKWLKDTYNMDIYGVDICIEMLDYAKSLFPQFSDKLYHGNAADLNMFKDNFFDIVQHLDGMEHIPIEWEEDALKEAVRVSKKYIIYNNACGTSHVDVVKMTTGNGFTHAHINIKTYTEWQNFYKKYSEKFNYKIISETGWSNHDHTPQQRGEYVVILQKIGGNL